MNRRPRNEPVSDEIANEFQRLFWEARKEHVKSGKFASVDRPRHQAALTYARQHNVPGAETLLQASLQACRDGSAGALDLLEAEDQFAPQLAGVRWFIQARIRDAGKEFDLAIREYLRALAAPHFQQPGGAWNNIGVTHWKKGDYTAAIAALRQALEDPNYDTPGTAWCNLGLIHADQGNYDEAIAAYRRALEDPNYDTPGKVWHNLGFAYYNEGNYDEAIAAYRRALETPNYDTSSLTWNNLAQAHYFAGHREQAVEALQHVPADSRDSWLASVLAADLSKEALSRDDRALLQNATTAGSLESPSETLATRGEEQTPEARMLEKLKGQQTQYDHYLERPPSDRDNVLSVLRGWSSAVTLIEGSERLWRGGGYLLKWRGKGIAIDPGFDFIRNLHDAGYHAREIDAVLVSHNHPDHNADLTSLDDLRYELYKRRHREQSGGGIEPYALFWDRDSDRAITFAAEKPEHQYPPILLDRGRCNPMDRITSRFGLPVNVEYFGVNHGTDVRGATGFRLELLDGADTIFTLGYTGDTEYFPELSQRLQGCDLLLAHISQPDPREFTDPNFRKQIHLGYRGLAELIREAKPKLTLVGEFWAGLSDLRIDLIQGLRRLTGTEAILPAGLGMHLELPTAKVECTECGAFTEPARVRVAPPAGRFGNLAYLCPGCLLGT